MTLAHQAVTDPEDIRTKALSGAFAIILRQGASQGLNILGSIFLTRILGPKEFGIYGILVFIAGVLTSLANSGLSMSLVRQPEEPTETDFRTVFTLQQIFCGFVACVLLGVSPLLQHAYHLPQSAVWHFGMLALAIVISSLQTVSIARMERHLDFHKLAVVEVLQVLVFNGIAIVGALRGWGGFCFALAFLAKTTVSCLCMNTLKKGIFRWEISRPHAKKHLGFGLPLLGVNAISTVKDGITPLLVGLVLGLTEVGYINWASMVAAYPALVLMIMQRIYLPAFARLQKHPSELTKFLETVLTLANLLVAPFALATLFWIHPLTKIVFGAQWLPAIPLFFLLWSANLFVPVSAPLIALMNAFGRSKVGFGYACAWMILTWTLGLPLVLAIGVLGFGVATMCVHFTNLDLIRRAQKLVNFRYYSLVWKPWAVAAGAGCVVAPFSALWKPNSPVLLGIHMIAYAIVYGMLVLLFYRAYAIEFLGFIKRGLGMRQGGSRLAKSS